MKKICKSVCRCLILLILSIGTCGIVSGLGIVLEPEHIGSDYSFNGNYSGGQVMITGSGSYYLAGDLNASDPGFGIQIVSPDVILDGNGKNLTGSGGFGISITPMGINATVTNFSAISGFSTAIDSTADSALVSDNVIYNNGIGINSRGNVSQILGNYVVWCYYGIRSWVINENPVTGGDHVVIADNYVLENDYYGIVSGGNHALISNNIVHRNKREGITAGGAYWVNHTDPGTVGLGYYSSVIGNLVLLNGNRGIYNLNPHARIQSNLVISNGQYGISLHRGSTNTTVSDNFIVNQSYGIRIMTNNYTDVTMYQNYIVDNPLHGIYLEYSPAYGAMGGNGTIFDNYLGNQINVGGSGSPGLFTWTHPAGPVPDVNIVNGPYLAGNYWSNPDGTGWSDLQNPTLTGYSDTPFEIMTGFGAYDTAPLVRTGQFINASNDEWTINYPFGNITYPKYSDAMYITQARPGAILDHLTIDGTPVEPEPDETYTFREIDENHYIKTIGRPVPGQVHVFFNATPITGDLPLMVSFRDQSIGDPTSWYWQFGDGGSSTDKDPTHQYTIPGTYTVSLRAYNDQTGGYRVMNDFIHVFK